MPPTVNSTNLKALMAQNNKRNVNVDLPFRVVGINKTTGQVTTVKVPVKAPPKQQTPPWSPLPWFPTKQPPEGTPIIVLPPGQQDPIGWTPINPPPMQQNDPILTYQQSCCSKCAGGQMSGTMGLSPAFTGFDDSGYGGGYVPSYGGGGYSTPPLVQQPILVAVQPQQDNNGTSLKLKEIFAGGTGLASQIISAFGKNQTQQIGLPGIAVIPTQQQQPGYYPPQNQYPQQQTVAPNPGAGDAAKSAIEKITDFVTENPLVVAAIVGGVLLFKRDPNKRRG